MKKWSTLTRRLVSLAIAFVMMLQILPFSIFESSAALTETPLRPQLLGGSLDSGDDNVLSIFVFGDAMIQANGMMDIVKNFAARDGIRLEISANTWNNEGKISSSGTPTSTYNMWELFTWSEYASGSSVRPSNNGNIVAPKKAKLAGFLSALYNTENPIDHVILLAGRDYSLDWYPNIEQKCVNWFASQLAQYSPDGQVHLFAAPGFSDDYQYTKSLTGTNYTRAQHTARIKEHALEISSAVTGIDSSVYAIGDAWEAFLTDSAVNQGSDLDLYSTDLRNPSLAGSYFNACLLYMMLTGYSPVGMDVYGQMQAEDARLLQRAAHMHYFGEAATVSVRNDANALTLDTLIYPCTTDTRLIENASEYPTYFNELMATAIAFDQRGEWVQYDQTSFNENTPWDSLYRRVISDNLMAPEQATPQNPYYSDCSAWTTSLYAYTFGFYFNSDGNTTKGSSNLTSTGVLCRLRDTYKNNGNNKNLCVWAWGESGQSISDANVTAAADSLYSILQPGDMIVYTNTYRTSGAAEGHAIIYVGNGYIMHCSGASQSAMGGADYDHQAGHDKHEVNGSILVEPLAIFTERNGSRLVFADSYEVVVLRPFATGTLTPTSQATARLNNLLNIVAYKESSVSLGQTVTAGQNVTFTYRIKNLNSSTKTVNIVESLPSSLVYVSSDGVYDSATGKVSFVSYVSPGEEKALRLTVRVSPDASGIIQMDKTATVNGVYLNTTPIVIGKTLSSAQQSKVAELLPSLSGYTDSYELAKALYAELGYTLPFANGGAALTSVFDYHTASASYNSTTDHFVLTGSDTTGTAMLAPHLFGGQYVACNHNVRCCSATYTVREGRTSGDYMRTRSMLECYLTPGDLLIYGNVAASPTVTVYIYAGNSTFYTATSSGLQTITGSATVQFLEGMISKDAFCVLRPSLALTCSKSDVNVLIIGGTSNTASIRQSQTLLKQLLETDGGYSNANVTALSLGGERVTFYNILSSANSDGTITVGTSFATQYNAVAEALSSTAATKYDYVMVSLGKEWNLVFDFPTYKNKEYGGFAHIEKLLYDHNPDATLIIQAGAGYRNMDGDNEPICLWGSSTQQYYTIGESYADHTANIKAQAYEFKNMLDSNGVPIKTEVLCTGDAFLFDSDHSLELFNLGWTTPSKTDTSYLYHNYYLPVNTGAYLVAGMLYNTVAGSLPESFTVSSWASYSVTSDQLNEINSILRDATADLRVLYIGGTASTAQMRSSDALLKSLLEEYGGYTNVKVDNIAIGERGRLDLLFSSFDSNGDPTFHTSYTQYSDAILAALAPDAICKYDYIFVPVGRDWNLFDDLSYQGRENNGYLWLEKYIYAHNPDATLLVGAPAGYLDVDGSDQEIKFWGSSSQKYFVAASSYADHTAVIRDRAAAITDLLNTDSTPLNVKLVNYGWAAVKVYNEGFDTHATSYSSSEGDAQQHYYGPGNPTAFIAAAALFGKITDIPLDAIEIYDWSATYCRSVSNDAAYSALENLSVSLSDVNVLFIGGSSVNATSNYSHTALKAMLEHNGGFSSAAVDVIYLDGWVGRMDNIFSYTGNVTDGFTVSGPNTSNASRAAIGQQVIDVLAENADVKYDYVVVSVAPFWNLTPADGGVYGPREIAAFEYTESLLYSHNPDATLYIAAGQGWISPDELSGTATEETYAIYAGSSEISFMGDDFEGHTAAILAQAETIRERLDANSTRLNVEVLNIGSLAVAFNNNGISVHDTANTYTAGERTYHSFPNNIAAYTFATAVYNTITNGSVNDITVLQWSAANQTASISAEQQSDVNAILSRELSDISVLIITGGTFGETTREPDDALRQMLAKDGGYNNVVVDTISLNGYYGRLDQLFTYSGTTITAMKSETDATYGTIITNIQTALDVNASVKYDHVIIVIGANWNISDSPENFPVREANTFEYLEGMIYAHNPDATLYITTPKGWMSTAEYNGQSGDHQIDLSNGTYVLATDFADHNQKLLSQAKNIESSLNENEVPLNVKIADFASASTVLHDMGYNLHPSGGTSSGFGKTYYVYATTTSAHLYASILFSKITGMPYYSTTVTQWGNGRSITDSCLTDIQNAIYAASCIG